MPATTFTAFLATVLFAALSIAVFGFVSLFTGTEVIEDRTAGTVMGPVMLGVTAAGFFGALLWFNSAVRQGRPGVAVIVAAVLGAPLLYAVVGGVIALLASGLPARGLLFFASRLVSPYGLSVAVCALLVAVGYLLVTRAPSRP